MFINLHDFEETFKLGLIPIPPGRCTTDVLFELVNEKTAKATLTLRVIEARECTEDIQKTVQKVLAIKELEGNTNHTTIMSSIVHGCEYEIVTV